MTRYRRKSTDEILTKISLTISPTLLMVVSEVAQKNEWSLSHTCEKLLREAVLHRNPHKKMDKKINPTNDY